MAAKKGLLAQMADAARRELMDGDASEPVVVPVQTAAPVAPMLTAFSSPTQSSPVTPVPFAGAPYTATSTYVAAEPVDPEALDMLQKEVLVESLNGRASLFMLFLRMWETLGRPGDATAPLNALKVTNPSLTAEAIIKDAEAHMALLDAAKGKAEAEFTKFAEQSLGSKDIEAKSLQDANAHATAEIARHQKEINDRNAAILGLQQKRSEDESALQRARTRTLNAENVVRTQLQQAQALLNR